MTIMLTLGVSSCKTTNQAIKPVPETQFIRDTPNAKTYSPPSVVASNSSPESPEPRRIFPKLGALQNLTSNQVHALLGTPRFKRSDNPAEIWQYSNNKCTLDLFLYKNLNAAVHSVDHYEIRLQPNHAITENECFELVIKASAQAP